MQTDVPPSSNPKLIESTHISSNFFFFPLAYKKLALVHSAHTRRNHLWARVANTDINGASSLNSLPKAHTVVLKLSHAKKKPQCSLPSLHIRPLSMFFCVFPSSHLLEKWHVFSPWLVSLSSVWRLYDRVQWRHSQPGLPRELPEQPGL